MWSRETTINSLEPKKTEPENTSHCNLDISTKNQAIKLIFSGIDASWCAWDVPRRTSTNSWRLRNGGGVTTTVNLVDFPPKWMVSFNRKGTSVSLSDLAQCPRVRYTTTGDYNCKNNSKGQKKQIIRVILLLLLQLSLLKIIERGWLIWLNL